MIRLLLRLYPAGWRARYGDEFEALLEERPLGPFDVADILLAAIDARLSARGRTAASSSTRSIAMTLRIGGYGALLGGPLWVVALLGASGLAGDVSGGPWLALVIAGTVSLLVAFAGLSSFQSRRYPVLVWAAFLIPAVGAVVSVVGLLGMLLVGERRFVLDYDAWTVWLIGSIAMLGGSALFAVVTLATRTLSRIGAVLVGVSSLLIFPSSSRALEVSEVVAVALIIATLAAFAAGWIALGTSALRVPRIVAPSFPGAGLAG